MVDFTHPSSVRPSLSGTQVWSFNGIRVRGMELHCQGNESCAGYVDFYSAASSSPRSMHIELTSRRRLRFERAARMRRHTTGRGRSEGFKRQGWLVRRARTGLRLRGGPGERRVQRRDGGVRLRYVVRLGDAYMHPYRRQPRTMQLRVCVHVGPSDFDLTCLKSVVDG